MLLCPFVVVKCWKFIVHLFSVVINVFDTFVDITLDEVTWTNRLTLKFFGNFQFNLCLFIRLLSTELLVEFFHFIIINFDGRLSRNLCRDLWVVSQESRKTYCPCTKQSLILTLKFEQPICRIIRHRFGVCVNCFTLKSGCVG